MSTRCQHAFYTTFLFLVTLSFVLSITQVSHAQAPTATITQLTGSAVAVIGGTEVKAELDMVLTEGDTLETKTGAEATLTLSDGSTIQVRTNTRLTLDLLLYMPEQARQSRLKLLYGRVRAFLSAGHQREGSKFDLKLTQKLT